LLQGNNMSVLSTVTLGRSKIQATLELTNFLILALVC